MEFSGRREEFDSSFTENRESRDKKINAIDSLLEPTVENSALLYDKIKKHVFEGVTNIKRRKKFTEKHGYLASRLEAIGKDTVELAEKKVIENPEFHRALITSKSGGKKQEHTFLSIGLAKTIVDQMRRITHIITEPESEQITEHVLTQMNMVPITREKIETMMDKSENQIAERARKLLDSIPEGPKRDQYQVAWDILESEIY